MKQKVIISYNVNYSQEVKMNLPKNFEYMDNSEIEFGDILEDNDEVIDSLEIPDGHKCNYNSGGFEITHISK